MADVLEKMYKAHLEWETSEISTNDSQNQLWGPRFLDLCFSCVHNCAMVEENVHAIRKNNFIEIIQPYLQSPQDIFRLFALATLADIINVEESEMLKANMDTVKFLLNRFDRSLDAPDRRYKAWRSVELCRAIRQIARNDANKKLLVELGVLPLILKMGTDGNITEQREAIHALWVLSFEDDNRKEILQDQKLMSLLSKHMNSKDSIIRKSCNGALWNLTKEERQKQSDKLVDTVQDVQNRHTGHVMISYQWANQKTMIQIRDVLKSKGCKVWMDIDEMEGSTIQAMAEAVEQASVVLVCMSQKYKDSPNCRAEAEYSFQKRKTIVPLLLQRDYKPDGWLGFILGAKLFFDFSGKYPFDDKMNGLLKELEIEFGHKPLLPDVVRDKDSSQKFSADGTGGLVPHASNGAGASLNRVKQWKKEDVSKWVSKYELPSSFTTLTGKAVAMLVQMRREAPESFYQGLRNDLQVKDYNVMAQVLEALESLNG